MEISALHINNKQNDKYTEHPKASSAPNNKRTKQCATLEKELKTPVIRWLRNYCAPHRNFQ